MERVPLIAAGAAQHDRPIGVTAEREGDRVGVDSLNGRSRRVGQDGVITTVFDSGEASGAKQPKGAPVIELPDKRQLGPVRTG